jgi:hypothetical protein
MKNTPLDELQLRAIVERVTTQQMRTRPLDEIESKNLAILNTSGCKSTLLFVTATGLKKNILDATEPFRALLKENGIHDFAHQSQGTQNKVYRRGVILGSTSVVPVKISLYRPNTKDGDPRFWISRFPLFASGNDVCAIFVFDGAIHLHNLTRSRICFDSDGSLEPTTFQFLADANRENNSISIELLGRLKKIAAAGLLKAVCKGDTAIGRTIEDALDIEMNSKKIPDYHGIELKGARSYKNRDQLFAAVPDWDISYLKSSYDILMKYGYKFPPQLNVTVNGRKENAQKLLLVVDPFAKHLHEICVSNPREDVCTWRLEKLHAALKKKHKETFWIKAKSSRTPNGDEYFQLEEVIHTSNPCVDQFNRLLTDGSITLDHMSSLELYPSGPKNCRGNIRIGKCDEKGPSFKVIPKRTQELFLGQPFTYPLI